MLGTGAAGAAAIGSVVGAIYGYGRLAARVDAVEKSDDRHTREILSITKRLEAKVERDSMSELRQDVREIREVLETKVDRDQFSSLEAYVRETRDMTLQMYRKQMGTG